MSQIIFAIPAFCLAHISKPTFHFYVINFLLNINVILNAQSDPEGKVNIYLYWKIIILVILRISVAKFLVINKYYILFTIFTFQMTNLLRRVLNFKKFGHRQKCTLQLVCEYSVSVV